MNFILKFTYALYLEKIKAKEKGEVNIENLHGLAVMMHKIINELIIHVRQWMYLKNKKTKN